MHFDGSQSTTTDVVRGAIIPLSKDLRCAHSQVMNGNRRAPPQTMVTHSWGNLYRDLVAAILAFALQETNFEKFAIMLDEDPEELERWVKRANVGHHTFWVCAHCVNQHASICASNP